MAGREGEAVPQKMFDFAPEVIFIGFGKESQPVYLPDSGSYPQQVRPRTRSRVISATCLPWNRAMVERVIRGTPTVKLARDFHETLIEVFLGIALRLRDETGITTVALSGGCWQNRILSVLFPDRLRAAGFEVLSNRLAPVNDGGVSLGQAYIASPLARQGGMY
ncbi:hypothetical protein ACFL5H_02400 [Candidatus Latescibacterota bacterium]